MNRVLVRIGSCAGAMVLVVAVLWSAGLPPDQWLSRLSAWWMESPGSNHPAAVAAVPPPQSVLKESEPAAAPTAGTDSSTSLTPQQLYLIAASPGRNSREGSARIGTDIDNPQTYAAGAVLANGAQLMEIHRDYVVLGQARRTVRLELYSRGRVMARSDDALLNVVAQPISPPAHNTREVITDYIRPSPVFNGEMLHGYQVYAGTRSGVFSRLGLQAGDVITAIDGVALSDPQQSMDLFRQVIAGAAVSATIERQGMRQQIVLDGAIVVADQEAEQRPPAAALAGHLSPPI